MHVGNISTDGRAHGVSMQKINSTFYALVAGDAGLQIFNVSDP